jgi:hypothetical protein
MTPKADRKHLSIDIFLLIIALLLTCYSILIMLHVRINPDEIEHLHSAWYIKNGYLPFKDFFQHHNPFLWYLLVPLPGLSSENPEVIIQARGLMTIFLLATAVMASVCAKKIGGERTHALLAYVIMYSVLFFVVKSIEVRPDGLSSLLVVVSFYFFLAATKGDTKNLVLTGVFVAAAFLVSQKAVFVYGFYAVYFALAMLRNKMKIGSFCIFMALLFSPLLVSVAYGYFTGCLREYLFCAYVLNILKKGVTSSYIDLLPTFKDNWFFWLVSAATLGYSMIKFKDHPKLALSSLLGLIVFIGAFSASFHLQYYLSAVPFLAVASSVFILNLVKQNRWRGVLITVIVCMYIYLPVTKTKHFADNVNGARIAKIEYFTELTSDKDCVYDERREFNIFRRDAHYLWYHASLRKQYIAASGNYTSFNRCQIIRNTRPAVVDGEAYRFSKCEVYNEYEQSQYEEFYLRK